MSNNHSDKIKSDVDWLKHDCNVKHDYQLVKSGKSVFNLPKHQIYSTTHNSIQNYFINPKNNYSQNPYGTNSSFYIDFEVAKLDSLFHQFVLRYSLKNTHATATGVLMPSALQIEKISLLKNSNSLGLDTDSWEVFLFNLNKYYNEQQKNDISILGLTNNVDNNLVSVSYPPNTTVNHCIELPVSLNRSYLLASKIVDNLVLRVYFKSDIVYDGINNSDLVLGDVQLVLRMEELNNSQLAHLYKQPKFNHMFNKKIVQRYNINKLDAGIEVSVPLAGFRNVAGALLLYLTYPLNDIKLSNHGYQSHLIKFQLDNVYLVDSTGRNVQNNNKQDYVWNQYLMSNHFRLSNEVFNKLCYGSNGVNAGNIFYMPFCSDGSDSFTGHYGGAYSFSGSADHSIRFTPRLSVNTNVILNVIAFCPSLLTLESGSLFENYA